MTMAPVSDPPRERLAVAETQLDMLAERVARIDEIRLPALEAAIAEHRAEAKAAWARVSGIMLAMGAVWTLVVTVASIILGLRH